MLHSLVNNNLVKFIIGLIKYLCQDQKKTLPEILLTLVTFISYQVLLAEIISHYFPKLVEMHNYVATTSATTKLGNWNTLNSLLLNNLEKVLKKLNYQISKNDIEHIITCTPDVI